MLTSTEPVPSDISPLAYAVERGRQLRGCVDLFTETDISMMLGVSEQTLRLWRISGTGPKFAKLGRGTYYRREDILEWIAASVTTSTGG